MSQPSLFWNILRNRIHEVRNFLRFPRRLHFEPANGPGLRVILFGLPYSDWNRSLADRRLWQDLGVVAEVRRVPALRGLLPWSARRTVVIPMKTEHVSAVPRRYRGPMPDRRMVAVLGDKQAFQDYLAAHGLQASAPASYPDPGQAVFPCVVKCLDLSASAGVEIAHSRAHLDEILASGFFVDRPWLLQELVPGETEYSTYAICDGGRLLWDCTFRWTLPDRAMIKNEDNSGPRTLVVTPVDVRHQIEAVLAPLAYRGPCVIDYKLGADGRVRIFEINPRLGGSLLQADHGKQLREALGCILAAAR